MSACNNNRNLKSNKQNAIGHLTTAINFSEMKITVSEKVDFGKLGEIN